MKPMRFHHKNRPYILKNNGIFFGKIRVCSFDKRRSYNADSIQGAAAKALAKRDALVGVDTSANVTDLVDRRKARSHGQTRR